jgi:hypothetical protein
MNCNEARQHWNLYYDSEGDAEPQFQIGEHLASCPACAEWFSQMAGLQGPLEVNLRAGPPTPELWADVLANAGLAKPAASRRWFLFTGIAASVALGLAFLAYRLFAGGPDLAELSADWHQRLVDHREKPAYDGRSDGALGIGGQISLDLRMEAYLKKQVAFPVRCPPRQNADFYVEGAGVASLHEQPTAYLHGRVDSVPVSIFILPKASLDQFPRQKERLTDRSTLHGREAGFAFVLGVIDQNAVLVIGDTAADRLERVLGAYASYPH